MQAFDKHLKDRRLHFKDIFAEHDRDRSGTLDAAELSRLVHSVLPQAMKAQLQYFQVRLTNQFERRSRSTALDIPS